MNTKTTVLITGCSSGFGKASALHFLARGWNVIATMRSPKAGYSKAATGCLLRRLDVTSPKSISDAIQRE
jgi:NAD(P)-dependent dehydrogenase (short-subunit alcohol dehydrogenase family)